MQCTVFRQGEIRIFCQQFPCRLLHLLKQTGILCQVGDLERGQAMLCMRLRQSSVTWSVMRMQ